MVVHLRYAGSRLQLERGDFLCHYLAAVFSPLQDVDKFVFEIARDETRGKRNNLIALQLSEPEWSRVDLFLNLLAVSIVHSDKI